MFAKFSMRKPQYILVLVFIVLIVTSSVFLQAFSKNKNHKKSIHIHKVVTYSLHTYTSDFDIPISHESIAMTSNNSKLVRVSDVETMPRKSTTNTSQDIADDNDDDDNSIDTNSSITHWMTMNKDNIKELLKETAQKTKTKWVSTLVSQSNPVPKPTQKNIKIIIYIVNTGDTLFSIAKHYKVSIASIARANNLADSNLTIGQKLRIIVEEIIPLKGSEKNLTANSSKALTPQGITSKPTTVTNSMKHDTQVITSNNDKNQANKRFVYPKYRYYKIRRGDTLYSVSKKFHMNADKIVAINNLKTPEMYPGEVIKVKTHYSTHNKGQVIFNWPLVGRVLLGFGAQKSGRINEGINILAKKGDSVRSAGSGVVIYKGNSLKNFGNLILIQHKNNWVSVYAMLEGIKVKRGDVVKKGQVIASVGKTKRFSVPQLHFELRKDVHPKDPLKYLNSYT